MSERAIPADVLALIAAKRVKPVLFIFADFPSQARRIWTGVGTYTDGSAQVWQPMGGELSIGGVSETVDSGSQGLKVRLSGLDETIVAQLTADKYQGQTAELLLGFQDLGTHQIKMMGEPIWKGTLDQDSLTFSKDNSALEVMCEHRLTDILRKREVRYSHQDQQLLHPGENDTGLIHIESIIDVTITWGRSSK